MKIKNPDPVNPLPLGGWYVRDTGLRRFTFPPGASIPPNSSIKVYAGQGESFGGEFFWNLTAPVFDNTTGDDRGMGEGAYLFDPQGDIRAWMIYPCRVGCTDPAQGGQLALDVNPRRKEVVVIKSNATRPLDLENYLLKSKPYSYAFPPGSILNPGETMRVFTQGDPAEDTRFDKH